jgi:hypothetical protein
MKRRRTQGTSGIGPIVGLIVAVLILPLHVGAGPPQPDPEAAASLLKVAGEGFRIHQTRHFTIAYDTQYEALRPLVGRLEGTYGAIRRFCSASDLGGEGHAGFLQVILFDRYDDFATYLSGIGRRAGSTAGIYNQQTNIAAFGNMADHPDFQRIIHQIERFGEQLGRLEERRSSSAATRARRKDLQYQLSALRLQREGLAKRFNRLVVQHEIAHQMFFNMGVHVRGADNPNWLIEGLACQFEVPQAAATRPMSKINHVRLADFRDALKVAPNARSVPDEAYETAVKDGNPAPLVDFISDSELFTERGGKIAFRYAQAWALVYYLNREHRAAFVTYLHRLGKRRPGEAIERERELDEFRSAFGEPDDAFQRNWVNYMVKLRFDRREAGR